MNLKWHIELLEAVGILATKSRIVNKLNSVAIRSDDPVLQDIAENLIFEIKRSSTNTNILSPKDQKNAIPSAKTAVNYCESVIRKTERDITKICI